IVCTKKEHGIYLISIFSQELGDIRVWAAFRSAEYRNRFRIIRVIRHKMKAIGRAVLKMFDRTAFKFFRVNREVIHIFHVPIKPPLLAVIKTHRKYSGNEQNNEYNQAQ